VPSALAAAPPPLLLRHLLATAGIAEITFLWSAWVPLFLVCGMLPSTIHYRKLMPMFVLSPKIKTCPAL
jgi:hypothetical protein